MAFLSSEEIQKIGFNSVGNNPMISDKASFYNADQITLGDSVRIDDFCVFSAGDGGILIGNYIHVAVFSSFIGKGRITLSDFSNISSRVSVYSSNDDYSGEFMTNPTVPSDYTSVDHSAVTIGKHVIIGSGTVVLPGVTLNTGSAVGALSLVNSDCDEFTVYAGNPIKRLKPRKRNLLSLELDLLKTIK